jgi:hypothetical protein
MINEFKSPLSYSSRLWTQRKEIWTKQESLERTCDTCFLSDASNCWIKQDQQKHTTDNFQFIRPFQYIVSTTSSPPPLPTGAAHFPTTTFYFAVLNYVVGASVAQSLFVSDYRLNDRGSIPGRGKGFFL